MVWNKEAAAVKLALSTWRHWLEGSKVPFEVWTGHKNLEMLQFPRLLGAKQLRLAEFFSKFQFILKHLPRKLNFLEDALSHLPQHKSQKEDVVDTMFARAQLGGYAQ